MRLTRVTAALLAFLNVLSTSSRTSAQTLHESPFYCDMSMLSAADRAHKEEIGGRLAAVRLGVRELPNGYEFRFPSDAATLAQVSDWISTERLCCPFFDFDMRLESERGPIALRLTGRKGTKAFIKADFGRWLE
ncbi:MAG TPA: hypothetical protein VGJ29_07690 [Vicinamibacterales bacterium]|jgi:hypothetical protein